MKTEVRKPGTKLTLLFCLLGALSAQAAEQLHDEYVMIVYSDLSHGRTILRGAPEDVVDRLLRRLDERVGGVADQINLCVAYTKMKQIELATRHCDAAIAESLRATDRRRSPATVGRQQVRAAMTDNAIALTNRGVLYALAGEPDKAADLFELAMAVKATEEYAENNLSRLRSSLVESDS